MSGATWLPGAIVEHAGHGEGPRSMTNPQIMENGWQHPIIHMGKLMIIRTKGSHVIHFHHDDRREWRRVMNLQNQPGANI